MRSERYFGCCVARILSGFGQSRTAEYSHRPNNLGNFGELPVSELRDQLAQRYTYMKGGGEAILTCIINTDQVNAIEALTAEGWTGSPWTKKKNHPETMVSIWYKLVDPQAE